MSQPEIQIPKLVAPTGLVDEYKALRAQFEIDRRIGGLVDRINGLLEDFKEGEKEIEKPILEQRDKNTAELQIKGRERWTRWFSVDKLDCPGAPGVRYQFMSNVYEGKSEYNQLFIWGKLADSEGVETSHQILAFIEKAKKLSEVSEECSKVPNKEWEIYGFDHKEITTESPEFSEMVRIANSAQG